MDKIAEDLRFITQKKHLRMEYIVSNHETAGMIDASNKREVRPLYYAHIDPDRFREVVTNVFDNAVKYTEEGAITLSITGNDDVVQVSVADTGPGIPSEDLPHLFQKFYRVDNSATRSIGGTPFFWFSGCIRRNVPRMMCPDCGDTTFILPMYKCC